MMHKLSCKKLHHLLPQSVVAPAQVKSLDRQLSDTERRLQEMVSASQRQTSLAQNEVIVSYDSHWHTQYQQALAVTSVCCMLSECPQEVTVFKSYQSPAGS